MFGYLGKEDAERIKSKSWANGKTGREAYKTPFLFTYRWINDDSLLFMPTKTIRVSENLDDYMTIPGVYSVPSGAINAPDDKSAKLIVMQMSHVHYFRQFYIISYSEVMYTRARYYYNGSWIIARWWRFDMSDAS